MGQTVAFNDDIVSFLDIFAAMRNWTTYMERVEYEYYRWNPCSYVEYTNRVFAPGMWCARP